MFLPKYLAIGCFKFHFACTILLLLVLLPIKVNLKYKPKIASQYSCY